MNIAPHILAHGNWISMEEFMEIALYDENSGYYSANIPGIGVRGDFSTSATLSDLLARRIISQWKQACRACGRNLPFIEVGGGNGDLAMAIARNLNLWQRLTTRYYMVDRSLALRNLQAMVGGYFVRIRTSIEKALKSTDGHAFIFSNELPDAFPARQFVYQESEWLELGLSVQDGRIIRQANRRPLPESSAFARWASEGQVVEVHESYHKWYAEWQKLWKCGTFVTIDYGEEIETLYYRRPAGTLRGYKAHTMLSADELPPLAGHCDITADVNFTDLRVLADRCLGDIVEFMTQRDFLLPCVNPNNAADAHLVATPGAGDHFRVLIQHRFAT